jgi:thiopurine S-methyltransferase
MEAQFWHDRWQQNQIGFHQDEVNLHLRNFLPQLELEPNALVFVPLCGKSRDLDWLVRQGYRVLGVELSPIAVQAFFAETERVAEVDRLRDFERMHGDGVTILCGDYFDLVADDVRDVAAVYDRASLIALPPLMRKEYVAHLAKILPPGTPGVLITMDYPADTMQGPPFAVSDAEIHALYAGEFDLELLADEDVLGASPRFRERGLSELRERVYRFQRR